MAMGTERSKALHNFTMPGDLRWGNQKFFRGMRVNSNGQIPADNHRGNSDPSDQRRSVSPELGRSPSSSCGVRRRKVEAERAMTFDLQLSAAEEEKKRVSILKNGFAEDGEIAAPPPPPPPPPPPSTVPSDVRPWNLRTRRASVKFSGGLGGGSASLAVEGGGAGNRHNNNTASLAAKFPLTGNIGDVGASGEKRERRKFSVPLSKKEIEEDFFAFVGHRPPRRPKKRARNVQKQMDTLFPGLWLTEVTPDMYKVAEAAAP